jgi:acyl-CoA hydrolase/GNAT superfamily N-acetyltransferase
MQHHETNWQSALGHKVCTPPEAVALIQPGRRILIGSGAAEPRRLVEAMVTHGDHLADNPVVHLLTLGPAPYVAPEMQDRFRHTAFFIGANVREAVHAGRANFMPVFLSDIPALISSRRVRIDVAMIMVSPPDRHGYVSLGVSVDIVRPAVETADLVLAEVNPQMPRSLGHSFLHVDAIDRLIPVDYSLPEIPPSPADDEARAIARHVATLIPDGATLQTGIGRIPDAVMQELHTKRDLGVHTEMFSDGVKELVEAGIITGRRKSRHPGKVVSSFIMGTRELYEWVHDNPVVEMRPTSHTNDPMIIAQHDTMVAINSALAVDLTGQVAADTLMGRFFSGIGGQVDFIRGASRSRGGRAIIALPATARDGTVSRIQAVFGEGAGVVTSRGDVHHVVTEFGVADLWGKNVRQRAMSLIEIAHPDVRGELLAAAKERRYVLMDEVAPRALYPWGEARRRDLPGGEEVLVRPVRLTDEETLQEMLYRLSDETVYRRFMAHKRTHPHDEMQKLVDLDYEQNMALVVCDTSRGHEEIIALGRYDVDPATNLADVALVVVDSWQGRGVGTALMAQLCEVAQARGVSGFDADMHPANRPLVTMLQKCGLRVTVEQDGDRLRVVSLFDTASR